MQDSGQASAERFTSCVGDPLVGLWSSVEQLWRQRQLSMSEIVRHKVTKGVFLSSFFLEELQFLCSQFHLLDLMQRK